MSFYEAIQVARDGKKIRHVGESAMYVRWDSVIQAYMWFNRKDKPDGDVWLTANNLDADWEVIEDNTN